MLKDLNISALLYGLIVILFKRRLIQPDLCFDSINDIDPWELKRKGCRGVILDKDNTITVFHNKYLVPEVTKAVRNFKEVFGSNLVILSNTAGFNNNQEQIEGIRVLRHRLKKPFGIKVVKDYFNNIDDLAIIGDRIFTDIVFGNRHNLLTIYCNPLSLKNKGIFYRWVIRYERSLIKK